MKLVNYDNRTLIYQRIRSDTRKDKKMPQTYTKAQYNILRHLIRQKKITRDFFEFLLSSLFNAKDWKSLSYLQMYELIHVLTFWKYEDGIEKI